MPNKKTTILRDVSPPPPIGGVDVIAAFDAATPAKQLGKKSPATAKTIDAAMVNGMVNSMANGAAAKPRKPAKKSTSKPTAKNTSGGLISVEEDGLARYLQEIKKYPVLTAAEEQALAHRWIDHGDRDAAHKLVTSHLRLVAKIAFGYRGYGLPMSELISEGNIGLMQAVRKFEPEKGFRLSTYAMWWIKASIHDYILRSWSLVKMGTTAAQKKLFFNLNKAKVKLQQMLGRPLGDSLNPEQVKTIADNLLVDEKDVAQMEQRMSGGGDQSLSAPIQTDGEEKSDWQSLLADSRDTPDVSLEAGDLIKRRQETITRAMAKLSPREREIVLKRHLGEEVETLEDLSAKYAVSRERIRQIEGRALDKLKDYLAKDYRTLL
ncbi:MAG: RNA polymerase sigma factor RpoH [Hydrotalea sp.]|nr:RNA polymerase sigma factor RpoH [Hydrotalea sp.]